MNTNDGLQSDPTVKNISSISKLEDIELTVSNIVSQNQNQPIKILPQKQSWLQFFKEKLDNFSLKIKRYWIDEEKAQQKRNENNLHFFKTPKKKDGISDSNTLKEGINKDLENDKGKKRILGKEQRQRKASQRNILDFYRKLYLAKARSKISIEEVPLFAPGLVCEWKPKPQHPEDIKPPQVSQPKQNDSMEIEKPEAKKEEQEIKKKNKCPPKVKVFMFGNRMISKPSISIKNKPKKEKTLTEQEKPKNKKKKESLRLSTYLQNLDSYDNRADYEKEDEDKDIFVKPTKKLFNNERIALYYERETLKIPDYHSKMKIASIERHSSEEQEIKPHPQRDILKENTYNILKEDNFFSRRTFETSKNELFKLEDPKPLESNFKTQNTFPNNPVKKDLGKIQSPSLLTFPVPKSFNWNNTSSNHKESYYRGELHQYDPSKFNNFSIQKQHEEDSYQNIFESENKEIRVKEIITHDDNISDSTSLSSKSKDNQDFQTGELKEKPQFPQFKMDYKFSKFYRE